MRTHWRYVLVLTGCLTLAVTSGAPRPLRSRPNIPTFMLHLLEEDKPPADVIRSLTPQNIVLSQETGREQEIQYLEFEIPDPAPNEHLEEAQLRIYASVHHQHRGLYGVERLLQVTLRSPEKENKNNNNIEATPTTLSHVYFKKNSWFTVNITTSFATWSKLRENKLYVYVHVLNPYTSVGGAGTLELVTRGQGTEPLLLLMYDLTDSQPERLNARAHNISRRSVQELEDYEEESNNIWDDDSSRPATPTVQTDSTGLILSGKLASRNKKPHRNLCRRKPLYVDFAEIEYDTWIVAPAGYEAYQCTGKCFYPVSEHLTPTKHAIVQTLLHMVAPKKTPRACCVPTKLQPISVLYVDQHGVLTYRFSFEDMVVAECGCR